MDVFAQVTENRLNGKQEGGNIGRLVVAFLDHANDPIESLPGPVIVREIIAPSAAYFCDGFQLLLLSPRRKVGETGGWKFHGWLSP